jgi:putative alpha-1,2-mannosidase
MVLLRQMPALKDYVTAAELIEAGLPKAILWNNDPQKKVASDIFIVATLQRAYNDFIIDKLAEFFGREAILAALLKHKARLSDELIERVTNYLQEYKAA